MKARPLAFLLLLAAGAHAEDRTALMRAHRGGVLRLTATTGAGTIDPQINYYLQMEGVFVVAFDGLVTFAKTEGNAGNQVIADLAEAVPPPLDGGRTYVFRLRRGLKFSTGAPITVDDVVASFRRLFKVASPNAASWYNVIVGADACLRAPPTCTLAGGVIADPAANTVTFHLTHPSAEFLDQIALPFASILPADTPATDLGTTPPAATGPYRIASYDPLRRLVLERNPYFRPFNDAAQPDGFVDRIVYSFGLSDEAEINAVENGTQDWMIEPLPLDRLAELGARFAPQIHINPFLGYYYLEMNTNLPPFDHLAARQAVAFAINRRAMINLFGGPALAEPLCQILPRGIGGFVPYCPYSAPPGAQWHAPDLARARKMVRDAGVAGTRVTLITSDIQVERSMGVYLQSLLNDIGFDASLHSVSENIDFTYIQNTNNRVQIGLTPWSDDYPLASDFPNVLLACDNFHPGSDASVNMAGICRPDIDAEMKRALVIGATDPQAADVVWAHVDREFTDLAPITTIFQYNWIDFVSARLGHFRYAPLPHMLLSEVWVQ